MGHDQKITVQTIKGRGRGKKIGIPTINFSIPASLTIAHGIYAGWLTVTGDRYPAAIHFGPRPVFGENDISLEAYILGGDIPAKLVIEAELEFVAFIREVADFGSPGDLVAQIEEDVRKIKMVLGITKL